jgi:hypothetical protein
MILARRLTLEWRIAPSLRNLTGIHKFIAYDRVHFLIPSKTIDMSLFTAEFSVKHRRHGSPLSAQYLSKSAQDTNWTSFRRNYWNTAVA